MVEPESINELLKSLPVFGVAYLIVLFPASSFIKAQLKPWIEDVQRDQSNSNSPSLENAGAMIGRLERFLMLTFILLNEYTAVGFVLALKAAYRFKDTDDHTRAEYMLMGTFLSLAVTLIVGLGTKLIVAMF